MPAASSGQGPRITQEEIATLRWQAELLARTYENFTFQAIKYLTLVNAGGAAALLTFLGTAQELRAWPTAWHSLGYFVAGLICVGVVAAANFLSAFVIAYDFGHRGERLARGEIGPSEVLQNPRKSKGLTILTAVAILSGFAAFACFICGARSGFTGFQDYLKSRNGSSEPKQLSPTGLRYSVHPGHWSAP